MGYATVADVQAKTIGRGTYTATSPITATQVIDFLEDTTAEINGILRARGYTVPVDTTATEALRLLRHGNALGAAAEVEAAAPNPHTSDGYARKLYQDFLKSLRAGDLELDAAKNTNESRGRSAYNATAVFTSTMEW